VMWPASAPLLLRLRTVPPDSQTPLHRLIIPTRTHTHTHIHTNTHTQTQTHTNTHTGKHYIVNGAKKWITGGMDSDW
jgi:hypothetical protein